MRVGALNAYRGSTELCDIDDGLQDGVIGG